MLEKRTATLEVVLLEIGEIKQIAKDSRKSVDDLRERVGVQNGRVQKLEEHKAYIKGLTTILALLVLPLAIRYFPEILKSVIGG